MLSRTRKIPRNQTDNEAVEKQLTSDFEVYEYLKENKLETNNIDSYARLLNTMVVEQNEHRTRLNKLKAEFNHIFDNTQNGESAEEVSFKNSFQIIQQKTCKEIEVSNDLEREIIETKKSLNLLKGDIGHLVSRNQSAKLLSSKISKVKIVAEDQLKRVTLAFTKDKEQIKLRNEMQKKFSKKLKNVSGFENNSLGRVKKYYAEAVVKKEEIFQKLMASQKINQNVEEVLILKDLKTEKDLKNLQQVKFLVNLAKVITHFTINKPENLTFSPENLVKMINLYYQDLLENEEDEIGYIDMGIIEDVVMDILAEYHKLEESIKAQSQFYNQLLKVRQEKRQKLNQQQQEQVDLLQKFDIQVIEGYRINQESQKSYKVKLKQYNKVLKTFFVLLQYLEKNVTFQSEKEPFKWIQNDKQMQPIEMRSSTEGPYHNYISSLHHIYQLLSCLDWNQQIEHFCEMNQDEISTFYDHLLFDVKKWISDLKKRFKNSYISQKFSQRRSKHKQTTFFENSQRTHAKKQSNQEQDDEINPSEKEPQIDNTRELERQDKQFYKNSASTSILNRAQTSTKAKRIKLLQDIDIDYYKMIKSTIKMEKQNTRKNYQFLRTFKRTKYASRDNILEQKRFQASFSVLFTKQSAPNNKAKFETSPSVFYKSLKKTESQEYYLKDQVKNQSTITPDNLTNLSRKNILNVRKAKCRLTDKLRIALSYT